MKKLLTIQDAKIAYNSLDSKQVISVEDNLADSIEAACKEKLPEVTEYYYSSADRAIAIMILEKLGYKFRTRNIRSNLGTTHELVVWGWAEE